MTSHARWSLPTILVLAAFLAVGCESTTSGQSGGRPDAGSNGEADGASGSGEGGAGKPVNMLEDRERNQLLLDLDRYTGEWQSMRGQGRVSAYGGLENLIRRQIDGKVDLVLSILKEQRDPRGRLIVSKALGFSRDPKTLAALVGLLRSDEPALLENALMGVALRLTKEPPADQVAMILANVDLVAMLLEHFDMGVRRNAALALRQMVRRGGRLPDKLRERAVMRLTVMLLDPDNPSIRGNAAGALGVLGGPEQESDLLSLIHDQDVYPRIRAIVALARIGTERSVEPLLQLLGAEEANIRRRAAQALWVVTNRLGYSLDGTVLGEKQEAWRRAIEARREG